MIEANLCLEVCFGIAGTAEKFRKAKMNEEEEILVEKVVPKSTLYKNKWAASGFFRMARTAKVKSAHAKTGWAV